MRCAALAGSVGRGSPPPETAAIGESVALAQEVLLWREYFAAVEQTDEDHPDANGRLSVGLNRALQIRGALGLDDEDEQ